MADRRRGTPFYDPLSHRRLQDHNDTFFDNPVCPCEAVEPEPQSEYDVPGEWITYTGEIDMRIFYNAARHAEADVKQKHANAAEEMARSEMAADPQKLDDSSAEAAPSTPVLDEDDLPIDPIRDEWSLYMPDQRARDADDAAERACVVARSSQRIARAARLARLPEALGLAKRVEGLAEHAMEATNFAWRDTIAAKRTADAHAQEHAAKVTQAQSAAAKVAHALKKLPVDPIKDEWSAFTAAQRAQDAADAALWALNAAEEGQRDADAARLAKLPDVSELAKNADSATQRAFETAHFVQRAADAAQRAAAAAACAEGQVVLAKVQNASAESQVLKAKPKDEEPKELF